MCAPPIVDKYSNEEVLTCMMWDKQDAFRTMAVNDAVFQSIMMDWIIPMEKRIKELEEEKLNG